MTSPGGSATQSGMIFQDLAAVRYFLTTGTNEINIEKHEDFSYFLLDKDPPERHFFESKSSSSGGMGWRTINGVVKNFYKLCDEFQDSEEKHIFHIISNYKMNQGPNTFFSDIDLLRNGTMRVESFRTRHDDRMDTLESHVEREIEGKFDSDVFNDMLIGLAFDFHTKKGLKSDIRSYVKNCNSGDTKAAINTIVNQFRTQTEVTIRRRDIEDELGFRLEQTVQRTNTSVSDEQAREQAREVYENYSQVDLDLSEEERNKQKIKNYSKNIANKSDIDSVLVSASETSIEEGLNQIEKGKESYQSGLEKLTSGIEHLFELDDDLEATDDKN